VLPQPGIISKRDASSVLPLMTTVNLASSAVWLAFAYLTNVAVVLVSCGISTFVCLFMLLLAVTFPAPQKYL
jgi:hypothetical protein